MRRTGAIAAMAGTMLLAGCMSSGTNVSDEQIDKFVKGRTTEAEIIAALGQPDMAQRSSDGTHSDMYTYTKVASNAQSFIPLIGGFIASSDTKTKIVTFKFSRANVLLDWESSGSASTLHSGLLNQH